MIRMNVGLTNSCFEESLAVMVFHVDVPDYDGRWIRLKWEDGAMLRVQMSGTEVLVAGNKEGLRSLANHLLNLSQEAVPAGTHVHLDENNSLEEGSAELIVQREA